MELPAADARESRGLRSRVIEPGCKPILRSLWKANPRVSDGTDAMIFLCEARKPCWRFSAARQPQRMVAKAATRDLTLLVGVKDSTGESGSPGPYSRT